jgi:hypothetical protein
MKFRNIMDKFKNRKKYKITDLNCFVLAIFGGLSFLIAWFWSIPLVKATISYVEIINELGQIDLIGTIAGFILLMIAANVWFFASLASKCNSELQVRMFG